MERQVALSRAVVLDPVPVWDASHRRLKVQVFGAGGAAGRELVAALLHAGHPPGLLSLFGRRGRNLPWQGGVLRISPVPAQLAWAELAFLCTPPDVARKLAPVLVARGTRVIDLTGACRQRTDLPLVVPELHANELGAFTQQVALPSRSAAVAVRPLWALEKALGLEEVVGTALLSCAVEGAQGILEMREELEDRRQGEVAHPHMGRLCNLLPLVGGPLEDGSSRIESELGGELRRILGRPDLAMDLTGLQTDVERCDAFSFAVRVRGPITAGGARQIFAAAAGLVLEEEFGGPTARGCVGSDMVHVGRIRAGSRGPTSLCFFAVGDQLRLGAANAALLAASILPLG